MDGAQDIDLQIPAAGNNVQDARVPPSRLREQLLDILVYPWRNLGTAVVGGFGILFIAIPVSILVLGGSYPTLLCEYPLLVEYYNGIVSSFIWSLPGLLLSLIISFRSINEDGVRRTLRACFEAFDRRVALCIFSFGLGIFFGPWAFAMGKTVCLDCEAKMIY